MEQLFEPLYLPNVIGKTLLSKNPNQGNIYWKTSICSIEDSSFSSNPLSPANWLRKKLSYPKNTQDIEQIDGVTLFSLYEAPYHDRLFKAAMYWVTNPCEVASNHLQTTQSMIFLVTEKASLTSQAKVLHDYIAIHNYPAPLTIFNATSLSNRKLLDELNVVALHEEFSYLILQWQIHALPVDSYNRISSNALQPLCESLLWQARVSSPQPSLIPIQIRSLVETFINDNIFLGFSANSTCNPVKLAHPSSITQMYRRALSYSYRLIQYNQHSDSSWPVREFIREQIDGPSLPPSHPQFDPDVHAGESYYFWNNYRTTNRLQTQLQNLNLPDFPCELDLFNYSECATCALEYIQHCESEFGEEFEFDMFRKLTFKLINSFRSSGCFPWKDFLQIMFNMKLNVLEDSLTSTEQLYFYEDSHGTLLSILRHELMREYNSLSYQYNDDMVDSSSESDYNEKEESIDDSIFHSKITIPETEEYSPPTKRYVVDDISLILC